MLVRTSKDKEHPYVMLNKTFLEDQNLSLKAKGLLAFCMCKPDGWEFHVEQMTTVLKEKKDALYSAFKELIKYGYCIRSRIRDTKGKIKTVDYILMEVPNIQQADHEKHPQAENPEVDNPLLGNPPLVINDNIVINDESNIHAPFSSSKKNQRKPFIQRIERRQFVFTSEEEHSKLLKKYGQILTEKAYDDLNRWKESKSEADPKKNDLHTDYYRIMKWVVKSILEEEKKPKQNSNKELVLEKFKNGGMYNGAECFINDESVAFQRGFTHMFVKFKDPGFKDQFENILRKFEIR
jgi:hypothetical protein